MPCRNMTPVARMRPRWEAVAWAASTSLAVTMVEEGAVAMVPVVERKEVRTKLEVMREVESQSNMWACEALILVFSSELRVY